MDFQTQLMLSHQPEKLKDIQFKKLLEMHNIFKSKENVKQSQDLSNEVFFDLKLTFPSMNDESEYLFNLNIEDFSTIDNELNIFDYSYECPQGLDPDSILDYHKFNKDDDFEIENMLNL